jgi:xylulokinase
MKLYVGHDLGTSGNKTVLVDAAGALVASHVDRYPLRHPRPDRAEQDPEDWWRAVCVGSRAVTAGVDPSRIAGVAFAGQMLALVPMDASGRPTRPAISWLDHRAEAEARRITRRFGGRAVLQRVAAGAPTGKDLVAKVAWLRRHEPAVHRATAAYGDATSYLVARATGRLGLDPTAAGGTGLFGGRKRQWSPVLARLVGFPLGRMPPVRPGTDVAPLTAAAAAALGLPAGLPVATGLADIPAAALGSGAMRSGQGHVYLGTSAWVGVIVDRPRHVPAAGIASVPSPAPRGALLIAESETGGACRDWFADRVAPLTDALAGAAPPGSDGLLFLPWLFGERAPIPDSRLRGGYAGLSMAHEQAHLARAVLEGVALNVREILQAIDRTVRRQPGLRAIGGGVQSELWLQILADVTGERITRTHHPRFAGAIGAALLAAVATGAFPDLEAAAAQVRVQGDTHPTPGSEAIYGPLHEAYRALVPAARRAGGILERSRGG